MDEGRRFPGIVPSRFYMRRHAFDAYEAPGRRRKIMNRFRLPLFTAMLAVAMLASATVAQETPTGTLRPVQGQTLVSNELPRADLTFGNDFHYVGGQKVNLYGNAEAEQHIFVVSHDRMVDRFYWVQFEHFLPTNKHTYDYHPDRTTDIGNLRFIYDVKSWPDYASNQQQDPDSDGAAMARLLGEHNLVFPKKTVRVRMFYLPTFDRRTELMIIYGEVVPDNSTVPMSDDGVELDKDAPDAAHLYLEHARRDLGIVKR
jgi:hypothetical protein